MRILRRSQNQKWFHVCSYCGREYGEGYDPIGDRLPDDYIKEIKKNGGDVSHGLCSECAPKIMGKDRWEKVKERLNLKN
jgi:DNA-directed RNA polymerase subunit RPC12/RpoP